MVGEVKEMKISSRKIKQSLYLIIVFLFIFVLYYYLFFTWNVYLWWRVIGNIPSLNGLLNEYKIYGDYFVYSTRIILATMAIALTIFFYSKSNNKKKFWKMYTLVLIIFIILTLISILPFGGI